MSGASRLVVQPLPQLLAGLEEGDGLLGNLDRGAGAWVATQPGGAMLDRKRAKSTQFHAVAARQCVGDLVEDRRHDPLDVALIEMRIEFRQAKNKLGFGHG